MSSPLPRSAILALLLFGTCGCSRETTSTAPTTAEVVGLAPLARQSTPDPRLTAVSPFRNVRPGVGYVGDAACATCHPALTASYHQHPMGRSAAIPKPGEGPERYDAASRLPVEVTGYRLDVARGPDRIEHVVSATAPAAASLPAYRASADVAIGSGTRGRSYLTCQDGAVWQSPLSWYAEGRWDVSPGFDLAHLARRAVEPGCLFCHVNRVEPVSGAVNRFVEPLLREQPAVGCERCHGPGQLHAAERANGVMPNGPDLTIVNPKHLSPDLRQDICRQCHLLGEARVMADGRGAFDFRPGLPLDDFIRVFVRHPAVADSGKSVGQFEQVETSTCHTGSGGRLVCTSCHDPHLSPEPADKPAFYRANCQACHSPPGGKDCAAPTAERTAAADNCVACHMPRGDSTNIVHATVTDHRIRRRPSVGQSGGRSHVLPDGATVVVPYRAGRSADADRDLGLGLARAVAKQTDPALRQLANRQALDRLTGAAGRRPADDVVWQTLAGLHHDFGRSAARLAAARSAARVVPQSEASLAVLASATTLADRPVEALAVGQQLVALNPTSVDYRVERVKAAVLAADWPQAEAAAREALAVYPLDPQARLFLAAALAKQGRGAEASREGAAALALQTDPRARADAERWLAGQLR